MEKLKRTFRKAAIKVSMKNVQMILSHLIIHKTLSCYSATSEEQITYSLLQYNSHCILNIHYIIKVTVAQIYFMDIHLFSLFPVNMIFVSANASN